MSKNVNFDNFSYIQEWGLECRRAELEAYDDKLCICHVKVSEIQSLTNKLVAAVLNDSWIKKLDIGNQRVYRRTARDTAEALVEIFLNPQFINGKVNEEFGEMVVSIGSTKALSAIFDHISIPVAELWKPQVKQNEGFDFHTVCPLNYINYGEAKFSAIENPYSKAINQADRFILDEKHFRDRVHLTNLVSPEGVGNLDKDLFGVVAAFSVNSRNTSLIFQNALKAIEEKIGLERARKIYLVGVSCDV